MKIFTINDLYKADTAKITWRQKLAYFFSFTVFYFTHLLTPLCMFSKTFFIFFFCLFNWFFGANKYILNRNLKTITYSKIYKFHSYFPSNVTVKSFYKLMEYFTQVFRNMPNYSSLQHNSNCKIAMLIFIFWLQTKIFITNQYVHISVISWDKII